MKQLIIFDEYADWPEYKWYRNPIKWWKLRRTMKLIDKANKRATIGEQWLHSTTTGKPGSTTKWIDKLTR